MVTKTLTFDLSKLDNSKGSATYGFSFSNGVLTPANKGVDASYAYAKLTFVMPENGTLTISVRQSSESGYDYGIISNLDTDLTYSNSPDTSGVKYNGKGLNGNKTVTFENVTKGTHFITVKYRKDGSVNQSDDVFTITSFAASYQVFTTTFTLSTLGLSEGAHNIIVKAKGKLLADSDASNEADYTVSHSGSSN